MKIQPDIKVPMRDGVELSADLFLPSGEGKWPTVFNMTPYGTNPDVDRAVAEPYVSKGYSYVAVDVRGRYDSGGNWYAHHPDEGQDGVDVISWIAKQSWSDGRIVTVGHSYSGWNQWLMAAERHPRHLAMASSGAPTDLFLEWPNLNGILSLLRIGTWAIGMMHGRGGPTDQVVTGFDKSFWHLPLSELDTVMLGHPIGYWQDWLEHDTLDAFWKDLSLEHHVEKNELPTLNISGWFDGCLKGQVAGYAAVVRSSGTPERHMLVIGPWNHSPMGEAPKFSMRAFGPNCDLNVVKLKAEWFDSILSDQPHPKYSGVYYFLQVANEWRHAAAWPVPGTQFTPYFLDSGGSANSLMGDGKLQRSSGTGPSDKFVYDPADPVPANWAGSRGAGILPTEPQDCREIEKRQDVLVYTTEPLAEAVEVTGPVQVVIFFETDVPDTDISVTLVDVSPDGSAFPLTYGMARARYRNSYETPTMCVPGEINRIEVELQPIGNFFQAGHSIRIEVSSSNFPTYSRNLNTGLNNNTTTGMRIANTHIIHTAQHPSHILLPVIAAGTTRAAALA